MIVSVAICTWNRARLLDMTLARMRELRVPVGVTWELIVVNNNCTDETDSVLARHAESLPLRRIFEAKQGHSNARNCAVENSKGELIIWTDDDVLVDAEWLAEYVKAATAYPDAGFFGGTIEPWFAEKPPSWILRNLKQLEGPLVIRQLGSQIRILGEKEDVFGANLAFRTELVRCRKFDPKLGRIGSGMLGSDEIGMISELRAQNNYGIWVGTAKVKHYIPKSRASIAFIWKFQHGIGRTLVRTDKGPPLADVRFFLGAPRWLYRAYFSSRTKSLFRWLMRRDWLDAYLRAALFAGMIAEIRSNQSSNCEAEFATRQA